MFRTPRRQAVTKNAKLIHLIARRQGVSLATAAKSLGWQPHTVRAAISRLRKNGHPIACVKTRRGHRYVIATGVA